MDTNRTEVFGGNEFLSPAKIRTSDCQAYSPVTQCVLLNTT